MSNVAMVKNNKEDRVNFRASSDERALLERAAKLEGLNLSSFVMHSATLAARVVIERYQTTTISCDAFDRLVSALEGEPQVQPRLLERMKRSRERLA